LARARTCGEARLREHGRVHLGRGRADHGAAALEQREDDPPGALPISTQRRARRPAARTEQRSVIFKSAREIMPPGAATLARRRAAALGYGRARAVPPDHHSFAPRYAMRIASRWRVLVQRNSGAARESRRRAPRFVRIEARVAG